MAGLFVNRDDTDGVVIRKAFLAEMKFNDSATTAYSNAPSESQRAATARHLNYHGIIASFRRFIELEKIIKSEGIIPMQRLH